MNGFWPLFKKEVRFLAAPAIIIFLFVHLTIRIGIYLLNFKFHSYYYQTVIDHIHEATFMNTFVWNPIIHDGALSFMYAVLLLYALIHEHNSRSKIQSDMLPIRRMTHLVTTFAAFSFWVVVFHVFMSIISKILFHKFFRIDTLLMLPYSGLLLSEITNAIETLAVAATGMLGYTVAVTLTQRWWRYVAGITTGLIGYMVMTQYISFFQIHIASIIPAIQLQGKQLIQVNIGYDLLSNASISIIFVIASLFLHERFSEE